MCMTAAYVARLRAAYYANSKRDAVEAGFVDLMIMNELNTPPAERRIPTLAVDNTAAVRVLHAWQQAQPKR